MIVSQDVVDVAMPLLKEQLVDVQKNVFQDRIRQWTFEHFTDIPEVVEEPAFKVFSQDGVDLSLDVPLPQMIEQLGQTEDSVSYRRFSMCPCLRLSILMCRQCLKFFKETVEMESQVKIWPRARSRSGKTCIEGTGSMAGQSPGLGWSKGLAVGPVPARGS